MKANTNFDLKMKWKLSERVMDASIDSGPSRLLVHANQFQEMKRRALIYDGPLIISPILLASPSLSLSRRQSLGTGWPIRSLTEDLL